MLTKKSSCDENKDLMDHIANLEDESYRLRSNTRVMESSPIYTQLLPLTFESSLEQLLHRKPLPYHLSHGTIKVRFP